MQNHLVESTQLLENNQTNRYNLTKIIKAGLSPLSALIGTTVYYSHLIENPILSGINTLLLGQRLGLDIWKIDQRPTGNKRILHSLKKIIMGLGVISLSNYTKFLNFSEAPFLPSTLAPPLYSTTTESIDPWPPLRQLSTISNENNTKLMDLGTYISLNAYGIANIVAGGAELLPVGAKNMVRIANIMSGISMVSAGITMGIENDFISSYTIPTVIAGTTEVIHNLVPLKIPSNTIEMQDTTFTDNMRNTINNITIRSNNVSSIHSWLPTASLNNEGESTLFNEAVISDLNNTNVGLRNLTL